MGLFRAIVADMLVYAVVVAVLAPLLAPGEELAQYATGLGSSPGLDLFFLHFWTLTQ